MRIPFADDRVDLQGEQKHVKACDQYLGAVDLLVVATARDHSFYWIVAAVGLNTDRRSKTRRIP